MLSMPVMIFIGTCNIMYMMWHVVRTLCILFWVLGVVAFKPAITLPALPQVKVRVFEALQRQVAREDSEVDYEVDEDGDVIMHDAYDCEWSDSDPQPEPEPEPEPQVQVPVPVQVQVQQAPAPLSKNRSERLFRYDPRQCCWAYVRVPCLAHLPTIHEAGEGEEHQYCARRRVLVVVETVDPAEAQADELAAAAWTAECEGTGTLVVDTSVPETELVDESLSQSCTRPRRPRRTELDDLLSFQDSEGRSYGSCHTEVQGRRVRRSVRLAR